VKTVTAYEVGGELFKDKKAAEKAEEERKKTMKRAKLIVELRDVCKKLGVEMPWPPEETPTRKETAAKFKVGDRIFTTKTGYRGTILRNTDMPGIWMTNLDGFGKAQTPANEKDMERLDDDYSCCPPEPKFKVGDQVTVISPPAWEGHTGVVDQIYNDAVYVKTGLWSYPFRASQLKKSESKTAPHFKIGDKVKLVNFKERTGCVGLDGATGTVMSCSDKHELRYEIRLDNRRGKIFAAEDNLEKTKTVSAKFKIGDRVRHKTQKKRNGKPYLGEVIGDSEYPNRTMVHWDGDCCGRGCAESDLLLAKKVAKRKR
jgi:heat shock protein HspQ